MIVSELIAQLQAQSPEAVVYMRCFGDDLFPEQEEVTQVHGQVERSEPHVYLS